MNDSTSTQYHHGALKTALLDCALSKLAAGQAVTEISVRALAAEVGVSKGAPRRHFASADELIAALAERGFEQLSAELRAAPAQDLTALGVVYVRFALNNRQLYRCMFHFPREQAARFEALVSASERTHQLLRAAIARLAPRRSGLAEREASLTAWSLVHGLADLLIQQQTPQQTDDRQLHALLSALVTGL